LDPQFQALTVCVYNLLVLQGMSEDVSGNKFFDEAMMVELAQQTGDLHLQMI